MSTTKTVRFADSPNDMYLYDSDQAASPIADRSPQWLLEKLLTSEEIPQPNMYYHSRLLNDTPSPEYHQPLPLSSFILPLRSGSKSSPAANVLSRIPSFHPPPTPDGLRNPVNLPSVEDFIGPTIVKLHECLRPPILDVDLAKDISPYILDVPDEPATSPTLLEDMVLVSKYLPWRIYISPGSVRDIVVALYTTLRTRVAKEELKTNRGASVRSAFMNRVEGMGEEEMRKGVRRVDFLLGFNRFVGIEATDKPRVWKICLASIK